jgi:hypothetical protein
MFGSHKVRGISWDDEWLQVSEAVLYFTDQQKRLWLTIRREGGLERMWRNSLSDYLNVSHTSSPYLTPPCEVTPLHNLRSLIFCLTPFVWLHSVTLISYFWWEYNFWFTTTFSGRQLERKIRGAWIQSLTGQYALALYANTFGVRVKMLYC